MKVLFFLVLAVSSIIFFSSFAVDSHGEVLLREPVLIEVEDGETVILMFTGIIIFPADNEEENILCLCDDESQGYYAKLTPQTKVFISGKLITGIKNLKEKLKSLNKVDASMYGLSQERIIMVDRRHKYYKEYWKVISIAPLNRK